MKELEFAIEDRKYKLEKDEYCWILSKILTVKKEGPTKGMQRLVDYRFFPNISAVSKYLIEMGLEVGDLNSLKDGVERIAKSLEHSLGYPSSSK